MATTFVKNIQLNGLLEHRCSSTGLYSPETFQSLYSCITRLVREYQMPGFVLTRTLGDESFETMAHALDDVPELPLFRLNEPGCFPQNSGVCEQTGFLVLLTDRMCATLFWSAASHETYRLYHGGWTFHPSDCRAIASQMIEQLDRPDLKALLENTSVDRRYDEKLNKLITSLVHGLEGRNRELTLALKQVQRLNKRNANTERMAALGQLSSVIAHEIRNPLGLIDLYAKLTEDQLQKILPPNQTAEETDATAQSPTNVVYKNLSLIRQAVGSLETILSELTQYSRPLSLNLQPTLINQFVADTCEFFSPSYQEKSVRLNWIPLPSEQWLSLDTDKIRQALINLLKNALEASAPSKQVYVQILMNPEEGTLSIQVKDEGSGIAEQHLQKLFTPYFSTKGSGTGLGLAHSQKILQAHGGRVDLISSRPQEGSTFALVLPLDAKDPGASA